MNRRSFITAGGALLSGCAYWPEGLENRCWGPGLAAPLAEHSLLGSAWEGIDATRYWDCHVHLLGTGDSGSGAWVSPQLTSFMHPLQLVQYRFYLNASCIDAPDDVDRQFLARLLACQSDLPPGNRLMVLAFDYVFDAEGNRRKDRSVFHVPNEYAARLAAEHPGRIEWIASVHPYRKDAVQALRRAAQGGARAVKWLPPAMGIDPGSPRCDAFYAALAQLDLPLLTHAGLERAVHGEGAQDFGNPLRLRRALDHGVRVIMAHCASLGTGVDLDRGPNGPETANFAMFERLMDEPRYEGRLFGEISALTQTNRLGTPLDRVIERTEWHPRLINGSDYPLPGVVPLLSTRVLIERGYLRSSEAAYIRQVRHYNPLLFDFLIKRFARRGEQRLGDVVFESRRIFDPTLTNPATG